MDGTDDLFRMENNNIIPGKGKVLIAEPFLEGRYFKRSLVLLVEFNKDGAVGFVLNKPINLTVDEVLINIAHFDGDVFIGGPVDTNRVYYIHTIPELIPQSIHIYDNLYWGGDFRVLKELIEQKMVLPDQVRFFAGYSGWTAGQLDDEIKEDSWLVSQLDVKDVMNCNNEKLWERSLRKMGGRYKMWSNFPENPGLN
ncbi:MAG: YqgE/AlgH family protein [Labilibaculum sp.]|nr:YqgE/AlgH family protein [Labilibaculum sp.]MBI9056518.1 YqgE/AlgH family protein [Labilibaculum sp.]